MSRLDQFSADFQAPIEHFKKDLASVRTGRATPALVENVTVAAYGTPTPLNQLGSITVSDPRSMVFEPWDKSLIDAVDKAVQAANLGISTANEGHHLRLSVPMMTEENRRDLTKVVREKMEAARIAIRGVRDHVKDAIHQLEETGEVNEDERFRLLKELDEVTANYNTTIKELADKKESDIMTV